MKNAWGIMNDKMEGGVLNHTGCTHIIHEWCVINIRDGTIMIIMCERGQNHVFPTIKSKEKFSVENQCRGAWIKPFKHEN